MVQICKNCGEMMITQGMMMICPRCGRSEQIAQSNADPAVFRQAEIENPDRNSKIITLVVLVCLTFVCGALNLFPLVCIFIIFIVRILRDILPRLNNNSFFDIDSIPQSAPINITREVPKTGDSKSSARIPNTRNDYINAFMSLNLMSLPLGRYGAEAVNQIRQLTDKQAALQAMLGWVHAFSASCKRAEEFVLENCKHIYYRLRYCDQRDPAFLHEHELYIREKLVENAKILHDFEKLIIEVTEMNDNELRPEPCMDVLAETLHNIRTHDGALEHQPAAPRVSLKKSEPTRQMMQL